MQLLYVHSDHLNAPRRLSRPADNAVVWRWESDPFGSTATANDPDGDGTPITYPLRFPGQYLDAETGLHYNYFRNYDPQIGRYVESDPIGLAGGINTYAYADGAPTQVSDPYGLSPAITLIEMLRRPKNALPDKDGCNEAEFEECERKCGRGKTLGCYVTVRWRLKGVRNGEPIRVNERTVNCRCADECDEFGRLPVTAWGARPLVSPVRVPVFTPVLP